MTCVTYLVSFLQIVYRYSSIQELLVNQVWEMKIENDSVVDCQAKYLAKQFKLSEVLRVRVEEV